MKKNGHEYKQVTDEHEHTHTHTYASAIQAHPWKILVAASDTLHWCTGFSDRERAQQKSGSYATIVTQARS